MWKKLFVFVMMVFFLTDCQSPERRGTMRISSPDFEHNGLIPKEYTCQGTDSNPALKISGVPAQAQSLALIMDDPDAPVGTWDHWLVFNIEPGTTSIPQKSVVGVQGKNSWGRNDYGGPCPPSGTHRYFFKLFALDSKLSLKEGASKQELQRAMEQHILEKAELIGLYKKSF